MHHATTETAKFGDGLTKAFHAAGFDVNAGNVDFIGATLNRGVTIRFGKNREAIATAVRNSLISSRTVDAVYRAPGIDDNKIRRNAFPKVFPAPG